MTLESKISPMDAGKATRVFNISVISGAIFTIGAYFFSIILRFGSNVVLSRLVTPDVFGVMLVINTLKSGVEMISDVGVVQNIVHNREGARPDFYNTAWTVQIIRGFVLFIVLSLAAYPIAYFYQLPVLAIQLAASTVVILGFASTSLYLLQRNLNLGKLNGFELTMDLLGACAVIALALVSPTIWSLIAANILMALIRVAASHLIAVNRNRLTLKRQHLVNILSFGKWIFISSLLSFLCLNFDKLYLAQSVPFALLGLYGIARNIADLPVNLIGRLGHTVLFPLMASQSSTSRHELRRQLAPMRLKLLALSAVGVAFGTSFADIAVQLIYDTRYHDAGWMLSLSLIGAWASILSTINEYSLLGLGKPAWGASANSFKLVYLVVAMPLAMTLSGIQALIAVIAMAEAIRYIPIAIGQRKLGMSFIRQDLALTAAMFSLIVFFVWVRHETGMEYPFATFFPALAGWI
jgi:O-antigen/teichoic acid export membrane protein